jgi:PAS domain S-box-containing protein
MTTVTLLIVEDDGILAANLESIIRELGYSVLGPVPSGEEAIDLLRKHAADLILMDIELAGALNGIETAERIGHSRDIPIVFLTGFSHDPLFDQAKIVGPYGYLVKPVPERELAATVAMSLHRHALDRELRESRKALAASEASYRYLFEQSPVGIFRISLEGRILLANLEFAKMLGCASTEEAVATFTDLKHQLFADSGSYQRFVDLLHMQGEVKLFNCQWQKKDGRLISISMNARLSAAGPETGDLAVIDGFALDITERKRAEEELQESEEKYRLLHESAGLGIGYYTPDGVVISYNEIASRLMNGRPEDFAGRSIHDLFPQEAALVYMDRINKAINSEAPQVYEDRVELSAITTWYLSTFTRIVDSSGTLLGVQIISNDISERKWAEEALRESEKRFRSYFDLPLIGIAITSLDKGWIEVNEQLSNILGYSREELVALTWAELTHPDDLALDVTNFEDVLAGKTEGYSIDKRFIRKDSTVVYTAISVRCVRRSDGTPDYFVALVQDITERKQVNEILVHQRKTYEQILEYSLAGYWDWDIPTGDEYLSPTFKKMFGYEDHEIANRAESWQKLIFAEDLPGVVDRFNVHVESRGREPFYNEVRYHHKNGSTVWVICTGKVIDWDDDGKAKRMIGCHIDITELKRSEGEKRMLTAQLQQAQKMEAIGTLAGGIAHDFNNILGAIVGYAEMIRDDFPAGSPGIHDINQVLKASFRAKDLVKQILTFSRQMEGQKNPMNPAVIVKEAINLLRSSLPTTIIINQDIAADVGMVLADPIHIHQIVMNLCTNAFHAMEAKGGTLTISLCNTILSQDDLATEAGLQPGTFVQLSITDTGEGILPEIRERIFDPFFTTKEVGKGTGLGLSMVYSIVKGSGGSLSCDSRVGEGTEFRILLPALAGHVVQENGSPEFTPHGKEHILLIDDEEMLVELGKTMLERLGYHVTTRRNSLDALTTFHNQPDAFDLIITDQTMPGMTGVDLARRILQLRPEMPIILCTGYSSQISEETAKAVGIKGFAYKPLAKKDIGELIRKILDDKSVQA